MRKMFERVIKTPLCLLKATSDERELYRLTFIDEDSNEADRAAPLLSLEEELFAYCAGQLRTFKTPCKIMGTPFQKKVWEALRAIPYGETRSYKEVAAQAGSPRAVRAVGSANGMNPFPLIIPCHRVIQASGLIGGFGGGVITKRRLLEHEKKVLWGSRSSLCNIS